MTGDRSARWTLIAAYAFAIAAILFMIVGLIPVAALLALFAVLTGVAARVRYRRKDTRP